jgi:hypothetical protein
MRPRSCLPSQIVRRRHIEKANDSVGVPERPYSRRVRFVLPAPPRRARPSLVRLDDRALGDWLARHALLLRPLALRHGPALAAHLGVPLAEVVASPFGLRMCALGAKAGATVVPRETRRVLPWHRAIRPGAPETNEGRWQDGVLEVGKYQQFAADEPRSVHHPEQHAKWTPHELLHRAAGAFFRPDASRFELYLGARLNELLPVAAWYGLEQHLRLDERGPFDRTVLDRNEALEGELFWLRAAPEALRQRAIAMAPIFRAGLVHAERELAACRHDRAAGAVSTVRHPEDFLDAASDALGYVASHTARLRAPAVGAVLAEGGRTTAELGRYARRIEALFETLLGGAIALDLARLGPKVAAARRLDRALRQAASAPSRPALALAVLRGAPPPRAVALDGEEPDVAQLRAGLRATLPSTLARAPWLAARLAADPALVARATLGERAARVLEQGHPELADLARLEGALAERRRADDRVEVLEDLEGPRERRVTSVVSRAFRVLRCAGDPLALLEGRAPSGPSALLVGRFRGGPVLVPLAPRHADALEAGELAALPAPVQRALAAAGVLLRLSR